MLSRLKRYFQVRKAKAREEQFRDGFGWAMAAYYCEGLSLDKIDAYTCGQRSPFDRGAVEASRMISNYHGGRA